MRTLIPLVPLAIFASTLCLPAAEPTPQQLRDPQWWFSRAVVEVKLIRDPEQQNLIGQFATATPGAPAPEAETQKEIELWLAKSREQGLVVRLEGDARDWSPRLRRGGYAQVMNLPKIILPVAKK